MPTPPVTTSAPDVVPFDAVLPVIAPVTDEMEVSPEMVPPVMLTALAACCDMLPETSAAVTMMAPLLALTRSTIAMD
jgi:hypothetical protein